jgi:hypothetical protein
MWKAASGPSQLPGVRKLYRQAQRKGKTQNPRGGEEAEVKALHLVLLLS